MVLLVCFLWTVEAIVGRVNRREGRVKKGGRKVGKKHDWKEGRWGSNKIRGRTRKVDGSIGKEQGEARGRGKDKEGIHSFCKCSYMHICRHH